MKLFRTLVMFTLAITPVSQCFAAPALATDPMIEGAKLCTRHLPRFEREYAIPTHLLSAIASTESGSYHDGLGMKLPWPWSINANGKSYFFESKEEAIMAVRRLQGKGIQSIDVGCMQVNLYHHPEAFASLNEAFEPQANIAYAAGFLRTLYDEGGTWKKAAANYHSRTPSLGAEYVGLVYDSWYTIIDKLRSARLAVPESSVVAMNELKGGRGDTTVARMEPETTSSAPRVYRVSSDTQPVKITRAKAEQEVALAEPSPEAYHPSHMNSIKVTSESDTPSVDYRQSSNILVIQPTNAQPATGTMAATSSMLPPAETSTMPVSPQASATAVQMVKPAETKAPEIKTADSSAMQSMPVQRMIVDPVTGHTVGQTSSLSSLAPAAGNRRNLDSSSDTRSGPNFIFND